MSRQLAADLITPVVEKQQHQVVQAICNAYVDLVVPRLQAHIKSLGGRPMTQKEIEHMMYIGVNALTRANARKEKSS